MKLKDLTLKWKITSGEIKGKWGDVYQYGTNRLGVYVTSKLRARPGFKREGWVLAQNGDYETTFSCPIADLDFAASLVGAKVVKSLKSKGQKQK